MGVLDRYREIAVPAGSVAVHWFEQSAFLIRASSGPQVLVDPYFPTDRPAERFIRTTPPVDPATLRPDVVLLTHEHGDHTHAPTIAVIAKASPATVFVGPHESIERIIADAEVARDRTRTVAAGDRVKEAAIVAHAVYAKPPEGDPERSIAPPKISHLGFVVEIGGRRLYVSGDPINSIAELPALVDPIRRLAPEIGFITTHPSEGEFPFFDGARDLAERIGLRVAVPSHYACFASRDYDPAAFSAAFAGSPVRVVVIPWNSAVVIAP